VMRKALPAAATVKKMPLRPLRRRGVSTGGALLGGESEVP
jgi:hypothetical protein